MERCRAAATAAAILLAGCVTSGSLPAKQSIQDGYCQVSSHFLENRYNLFQSIGNPREFVLHRKDSPYEFDSRGWVMVPRGKSREALDTVCAGRKLHDDFQIRNIARKGDNKPVAKYVSDHTDGHSLNPEVFPVADGQYAFWILPTENYDPRGLQLDRPVGDSPVKHTGDHNVINPSANENMPDDTSSPSVHEFGWGAASSNSGSTPTGTPFTHLWGRRGTILTDN